MGAAYEVISGKAVNPSTTFTALTMATGNSLTVRSAPLESNIWLEEIWAQEASLGAVRLRSPRMHDVAQGVRLRVSLSAKPLFGQFSRQRLYAQDTLLADMTGGASETDIMQFLVYYEDLPGIAQRIRSWDEIAPKVVNYSGAEQQVTTGATAGDYGGGQTANADFDNFKRNIDYALLGYLSDTIISGVGFQSVDTGNLRVAGPGTTEPLFTASWFVDMSQKTGRAYIPVINSANIGTSTFDVIATQTSTAVNVTLIFAELSGVGGTN